MCMHHEDLSRKTRSTQEDKQLLQSVVLFIVMAVFVAALLIIKF